MDEVKVYKIEFFGNSSSIYVTENKGEKIKQLLKEKDGSQNYVTIYDTLFHLSTISEIKPVKMGLLDLPECCRKDFIKENPNVLSSGIDTKKRETITRCFNQYGEEIKSNPIYKGRRNTEDNKPEDFVECSQYKYRGLEKPSKPFKEVYYRWVWDEGMWDVSICLIIQNGQIRQDSRPEGWDFVEKFNQNRPEDLM